MACKDQSSAERHRFICDAEDQCTIHACHPSNVCMPTSIMGAYYVKYLDDMHVVNDLTNLK